MSRLKMKKIVLFSILVCFLVALIGFGIFQKYHGEHQKEFVEELYQKKKKCELYLALKYEEYKMNIQLKFDEWIASAEDWKDKILALGIGEDESSKFVYYGTICKARFGDSMRFSLTDTSEASVSEALKKLDSEDFKILLSDCLNLKDKLRLGDWGYVDMLRVVSEHFLGKGTNEAVLLQIYILDQSGYNVRIAERDDKLLLVLTLEKNSRTSTYPYLRDNPQDYVLDEEAAKKKENHNYKSFEATLSGKKTASLKMSAIPRLSKDMGPSKIFKSEKYPDTFAEIAVNKNLIDFYKNYPLNKNFGNYVRASLSGEIKKTLYPVLRAQISGKTKLEAANILINFVQTAFNYKKDVDQFGYEKTFFGDETFYYPDSDCEDRSILFAILVRELLDLDLVFLVYPEHMATAIDFGDEEVPGSTIYWKGKKYVISDPTYKRAEIGQCMPEYQNVKPEIIEL